MTTHGSKPDRDVAAGNDAHQHRQYGRRVEMDGSWTVYHVFTGVRADVGKGEMIGLSQTEATHRMIALNQHGSRKDRASFDPPPLDLELRRIIS